MNQEKDKREVKRRIEKERVRGQKETKTKRHSTGTVPHSALGINVCAMFSEHGHSVSSESPVKRRFSILSDEVKNRYEGKKVKKDKTKTEISCHLILCMHVCIGLKGVVQL